LALGVFLYQKGDEEGALEALKKACELEQDDPFYFTALSAVAIKLGDHERAEAALMQAQEIRIAAQIKKMRELRDQENAAREERDRERERAEQSAQSEPNDGESDS
jgi:tetratricopeptide (TPR) repeat protein